jgi:hypothetical protein
MAKLESFSQTAPIKLLFIGDSGAGKTGALASLATAGYNLRIIDVDKGVPILANYLSDPNSQYFKTDPKAISRVSFVQVSDTMQNINGLLVPKKVEGWVKATKLLINWVDGDENLGAIQSWGPQDILVIDSLSGLSKLALHYHLFLNGALGKARTQNEARRDMGAAQNYIRDLLDLLYDDNVKCNVIVISHVTGVTEAGGAPKVEDGKFDQLPIGYPSAIGRALSPQISRWFNNMLVAHRIMQGNKAVHRIFTKPQIANGMLIGAKSSAPLKVKDEYPIETGLAEFFKDLKR